MTVTKLTDQIAECIRGLSLGRQARSWISRLVKPVALNLVFTAFCLTFGIKGTSGEQALLVVSFRNALHGIPPFKSGRQVASNYCKARVGFL